MLIGELFAKFSMKNLMRDYSWSLKVADLTATYSHKSIYTSESIATENKFLE